MAELKDVLVPDVGGDEVSVIELCVAVGDTVEQEDSLVTVETDKASMDIPAPFSGVVKSFKVAVGDQVSEGALIAVIEISDAAAADAPDEVAETAPVPVSEPAPAAAPTPAASAAPQVKPVDVPDIGGDEVEVTEVLIAVGDEIELDQGLITVEGDKASMEVPAPFAGKVVELKVAVGDKVEQGKLIAMVEAQGDAAPVVEDKPLAPTEPVSAATKPAPSVISTPATTGDVPKPPPVAAHPGSNQKPAGGVVHASPSVRRIAREFGVDLSKVTPTGPKRRVLKTDIQAYVKFELSRPKASGGVATANGAGLSVMAPPKVDFAKFGEIERVELSRIQKISGPNLHRNWVTIPHVTQFDEADITEMEAFRKEQNGLAAKQENGVKITPLAFIMKAVATALLTHPKFNTSLDPDGEHLIYKKYVHIGVAVDTPNGLVVPVFRDVDKKGIHALSVELGDVSKKARSGKLTAADMQGACFTISSLGGIGGTQFTPIVNAPDVAILGVSRSEVKPKWNGESFDPKLMLPLALSYDHRVIDGADAARFITTLSNTLADLRRIIL